MTHTAPGSNWAGRAAETIVRFAVENPLSAVEFVGDAVVLGVAGTYLARERDPLLALLGAAPLAGALVVAATVHPVWQSRYVAASLPVLVVAAAVEIGRWSGDRCRAALVTIVSTSEAAQFALQVVA